MLRSTQHDILNDCPVREYARAYGDKAISSDYRISSVGTSSRRLRRCGSLDASLARG